VGEETPPPSIAMMVLPRPEMQNGSLVLLVVVAAERLGSRHFDEDCASCRTDPVVVLHLLKLQQPVRTADRRPADGKSNEAPVAVQQQQQQAVKCSSRRCMQGTFAGS